MIFNWYSSFSFFSSSSIFFLNNTLKIFNSLKKLYLFSRSLLVGNWVGMSLWWVGKLALWEKKVKKNLDFDFPWCKYTHHRLFQVIWLTWLAKIFQELVLVYLADLWNYLALFCELISFSHLFYQMVFGYQKQALYCLS